MFTNRFAHSQRTTQRAQLRCSRTITALMLLSAILILSWDASEAGESVPDLRGQYEGYLFGPGVNGLRPVSSSFIEQDNLRRFTGLVVAGDGNHTGGVNFDIEGTIAASGKCTCVGTKDSQFVYQARWITFGGGAGALIGEGAMALSDGSVRGTLIQVRPFKFDMPDARPDIGGDYAGVVEGLKGTTGGLVLGITDGTSNTLTLKLEFHVGLEVSRFEAVGDVDTDGQVVAVGVSSDGSVLVLKGIVSPRDGVLAGTVSIQSAAGKLLDSGSIIAILIG